MKITRIYVDTSVIGGCCDFEFKEWSEGLLWLSGISRDSELITHLEKSEAFYG